MEDKKMEINPMHKKESQQYKYMLSPRCGAKTRKHTPCLAPAVKDKKRCRMHGGAKGSGAPLGSQNALTHGNTTHEAKAQKREVRDAIKLWRELQSEYDVT